MLANTLFVSLVMSLLTTLSGELISDSGWQPISREKVFDSRNFIKTQVNRNSEARNAEQFIDSTFGANLKLTNAREMFPRGFHSEDSNLKQEDFIQLAGDLKNHLNLPSTEQPSYRMSKKLSNVKENEVIDDTYSKQDTNELKHSYKISEEAEEIAGEQSNIIVDEFPKEERNPTNDFLKILSNYNIRSSDKLPNYSLSLRQNSRQSPGKDYLYINVPIRIPLRYNSPDHLPVDPLLAVLLSNYGYYLPGHYGIHGNYQNLYGYSASNNIHNNKPFGSYKIYSDTLY